MAAQRDALEDIIENAAQSLEVDLSTKADVIYNTASGNIASFNDGADDMNIRNLIVNIEPAQAGSGDPSPDNVRPISGHSGANIERRGKNLLKPFAKSVGIITRLEDGRIVINGTATGVQWLENSPVNAFHVKAGTYTLSGASSNAIQLYINYSYDNWATRIESVHNILQPVTITFERDAQIYLQCQVLSGTYDVIIYPQLELGSTATTYEPYTGNQISVNWEDEAGTIYGGILDLISGDLIVNYRYITIDGTNIRCTGGYGAAGPLYLPLVSISNYKSVSPWTCYCDKLKPTSISAELQSTDNTISVGNAGNGIALHIAGIQGTDGSQGYNSTQEVIDAANTWLQSNPITVCYLLETDTHYDITPQEVKTLYQYNNIWSDAGSVNVEYPADTKTYIDNKFAELQALILEH